MNLLSTDPERIAIEFSRHELHLLNALVSEGRISFECDQPSGQSLECGIRSIVIRMEEAISGGQGMTSTQ